MDSEPPQFSGLLTCDKPIGITSRDCINHLERLLRARYSKPAKLPKVGHAGTLDPLATGVLVVGIGAGVRLVPYIQQMTKHYRATFRLGWWSDSGDLDGEVHSEGAPLVPSLEQLQAAAGNLIGEITQIPPATSAIKVGGKKAYKYAHQGIAVDVPPRIVRVDKITIDRYDYPEVDLSIECGSGTYVRTLGMDLAIACGTRGVMTQLRRTRIGEFSLERSVSLDKLTFDLLTQHLLPLSLGASQLSRLGLDESQIAKVCTGLKIPQTDVTGLVEPAIVEAAVIDAAGNLRAICRKSGNLWCPYRVFHHRVS